MTSYDWLWLLVSNVKLRVFNTLSFFSLRSRNMLASRRYTDANFHDAIRLLRRLRSRPSYRIQDLFQRQFINKKLAGTMVLICLGKYLHINVWPSLPAFPCSFLFSFHLSLHPVSLRLPAQFASSISLLVSSLLLILISLYLFSPSASGLPSPLLLHSLFLLSSFISFLPLPFSLSFLSSPLFLFQHLIHPPFSSSLLPNFSTNVPMLVNLSPFQASMPPLTGPKYFCLTITVRRL